MAPAAVTVMLLAAAVVAEIVPVPATVSEPVLAMAIVPADLVEVSVPALVNVLPLTFIVMLLSDETVTDPFMLVAALVVVVTIPEPPVLRLRVVVLELVANVRP